MFKGGRFPGHLEYMDGPSNNNEEVASSKEMRPVSRRSFLAGLSGVAFGAGVIGSTTAVKAATNSPTIPRGFEESGWSTPEVLPADDRNGVIEWSGVKLENTALQEAVAKEYEELQGVPLWNLYAWRVNQNEIPRQPEEEGGLLSAFSITGYVGPLGVTANLGKVGEKVRKEFTDENGFVTEVAADVFADQIESDYPFVEKVGICDGLEHGSRIGCFGDAVPYTNPTANIRNKLTFETKHTVSVDWGLDYEITYRAFFVVQTYDTDVVSDLNKTFVVTASVFPEEISQTVANKVDLLSDYNFVKESRKFMKNAK